LQFTKAVAIAKVTTVLQ